jgi:hypothetical protein
MNKLSFNLIFCLSFSLVGLVQAQLKIGNNKSTISGNTYFEIESTNGSKVVVRKDTAMMGINNTNPSNRLEITHGTSGNSGLRFTNLTNVNTGFSSSSVNQRFLSVNNLGDVVLANSVDQVISVSGLGSNLVSPVSSSTFQAGTFENSYSKTDSTVLYLNQTDGTTWIYSAANGGQYKSYTAPASTAWFLNNTTTDAANNKTAAIARSGFVTIGANAALNTGAPLNVIQPTIASLVALGAFYSPNNNTAGSIMQLAFGQSNSSGNNAEARFIYQGNNAATNRVDFGISGNANPMISYLNNGNVGIGNISPSFKLDVAGKGRFTDTLFGTRAQFNNLTAGLSSDSIVTIDASGNLKRRNANSYSNNWFSRTTNTSATSNTENIYQMGQVGIGTTVPTSNLDVVGGFSLRNVAAAAGTNFGMEFNTNSNSPRIDWVYNGSYTGSFAGDADFFFRLQNSRSGAGGFRFLTSPAGVGVERLTILNNGNIGISTTLPQTLLDVSPSSGGSSITVGTVGTATTDQVTINFGTRYDRTNGVGSGTNLGWQIGGRGNAWPSPQANAFHASYWNGSSWFQAVTIQPTGNFGINTTNPTSRLEVNGSATNTTAFNAAAGTTIDFSRSNLAYTTANAGAFTLTNIKDGGTYTLAVQGTISGTASFTATNFTFRSINNVATIAGRQTLYTFIVMGTTVYFYMASGF